jgi:hypothetical protein
VAVHQFRNLGEDWKRALAELNVRLIQITPPADRGLVPSIPLNVDVFLEHCYTSLLTYDPVMILRAWEAAHLFVVDEYITKRSKPSWDIVWMMPVFQVELLRGGHAVGAAVSDAAQYCANWNFQLGMKCKLEPSADLSEDSQVRVLWRSSSCHQVRLSGLSPGGSWKFGPELAGSRPIRPRSACLGASAPIRLTRRVPESLLATISQSALPSPLNPDVWNRVLSEAEVPGKETIVTALCHGVPLSLEDAPFPGVRVPNHPMLYFDLPRVQAAVDEEVQHGRYVVLPPSTDPSLLNLSAMGVAPRFQSFEVRRAFEGFSHQHHRSLKHAALDDFEGRSVSGGPGLASLGTINDKVKWQVIHDLSHPIGENVNSFVESPYFELPTAVQFARCLSRGAYIWKGDVDKAFRIVPVRKRDWPLLAFHIDGVLYVDTRLPFGHGLSPYYFVNLIGRPVLYVAVRWGASLLGALAGYVDDFFGGCDTYEKALEQMELWLKVCADLGVPVSKAKTFLPSQIVEILGFIIDTVNMSISVDPERIQDILDEMARIEGRKAVRKDDLERLAGKMVFVCSVVPGGRTFMREILNTMNGLRQKRNTASWAHLSAGFQSDLRWWKRFALKWNGVESIPPPISIPWRWLTSDASGEHGLGVFVCGAAVHVPLPLDVLKNRSSKIVTNEEQELIIAETELIAMVLLVAVAAVLFPGEHLLLGADNTVAISWLGHISSSTSHARSQIAVAHSSHISCAHYGAIHAI